MTPVFVLTLQDIIGLFFLGIILLLALVFGLLVLIDKSQRWWKNRTHSTPVKPWAVDRDGRVRTDKDRPIELRAKQ